MHLLTSKENCFSKIRPKNFSVCTVVGQKKPLFLKSYAANALSCYTSLKNHPCKISAKKIIIYPMLKLF